MQDGTRFTLTWLDIALNDFSGIVREQITPVQLSAARTAYQNGQVISFGPLRVSQAGIEQEKRLLSWSHIKSVTLEANRLAIYNIAHRKPWYTLPAARVPNLYAFFALADEARGLTEKA